MIRPSFDNTKCPVCGNILPANGSYAPFCSERCRQVDLGMWFTEQYSIPAVEPPDEMDIEMLIDGMEEG